MPDFHAPFTREELEGRGWVFNGGRMTIPHSGWIIAINDALAFSIEEYDQEEIFVQFYTEFHDALAAAEALLKGVG